MNELFKSFDRAKLERMIEIKERYDSGEISLEEGRALIKKHVGKVSPQEFAAAEQMVKDEHPDECRNEDVVKMLDLFGDIEGRDLAKLAKTHPVFIYHSENEKMKALLKEGEALLEQKFIKNPWLEHMEKLLQYKVHYKRKQNQLYSVLETHGFNRPSTTMWTYDDFNRDNMNNAMALLQEDKYDEFIAAYKDMTPYILDLISKEELILYPTSLSLITDEEFEEMRHGDQEIGFFMMEVEAPKKEAPAAAPTGDLSQELLALLAKHNVIGGGNASPSGTLHVAEGELTLDQIHLIYQHMPVDFSYVDENELVRFYTDTEHRIFPRSKGVIGRQVKFCHPPKSVHLVEEIIEKFRSGEEDKIDFWINKPDSFIYILYVAVRDKDGKFRGVLEMMQDCTRIRKLEGSRTLLVWDEENSKKKEGDSEVDTTATAAAVAPEPQSSVTTQADAVAEQESEEDDIPEGDIPLTPQTKLGHLVRRYPTLVDVLVDKYPCYRPLKTPIAKVMLPIATLEMVSKRGNVPLEELYETISTHIESLKK